MMKIYKDLTTTLAFNDYIKGMLQKKPQYSGIRVTMVKEGGCGLSYKVKFYSQSEKDNFADDFYVENDSFDLIIDKNIVHLLNGTVLDYQVGVQKSGIIFQNPNEAKSCGCGTAFKFKTKTNEDGLESNPNNKC